MVGSKSNVESVQRMDAIEKIKTSFSELLVFWECPQKHYQKYILKIQDKDNSSTKASRRITKRGKRSISVSFALLRGAFVEEAPS